MRVLITGALILFVLAAGTLIPAQTKNEETNKAKAESAPAKAKKQQPPPALTSREVVSRLQLEVETAPYRERLKFKEFLADISAHLQTNDRAVTINVDMDAFIQDAPDAPNPFEMEVVINSNRQRATAFDLLNQAVKQIAKSPAALVIRAGRVDIVPASFTSKDHMYNQTVRAEFKEQRLDAALDELTDLTGVSLVLDPRARQKAQLTVTARFNGDVALQDAVRMLTEMADLKVVYLVTGLYITTPEHAGRMQKELKQIYEPAPAAVNPFAPMPDPMMFAPELSPLAPPLPPIGRNKRLEAAA